uniref:Macaca fascicularis brain cDNA clone: QflA-17167, similar to human hypothetical protein MGC33371 (MGC33371), mRNA, RefSeq: NM_144664.3 n=1 Tax=Macaca fascicularis TaxID=9541 RepID=I7GMI8_MACFA|nr:unnamed protein product [Macaca fascicularis]
MHIDFRKFCDLFLCDKGSCWSLNSFNYVKIVPQRVNFKLLLKE